MNLMFVVDDNYIDQMLVTLHSIFKNHKCDIHVYTITSGLQEDNYRKLESFIEKRGGKYGICSIRIPVLIQEG